ncbi:hypothetical protein C9994_03175 [Marivirga lumbricoides]|nr:hypothetical protein C9994_03175 [Marivirga lumbricoides]
MLGDFRVQDATEEAYTTLKGLLAWKGSKDNLNVEAQNPHPLNDDLGVIAGHRDGCSTSCPGQFVYDRLPLIRSEVAAQINECKEEPEEPEVTLITYTVYPNPVKSNYELNFVMDEVDQKTLDNILIYDSFGKKIKWEGILYQEKQITINLPHTLESGVYYLHVLRETATVTRKFVIL